MPKSTIACFAFAAGSILAPTGAHAQIDDPIPSPIRMSGPAIRLIEVASGLTAPNWATAAPGHADRLFVVDQSGSLWNIDLQTGVKSVIRSSDPHQPSAPATPQRPSACCAWRDL
jgi:hypothetical protein